MQVKIKKDGKQKNYNLINSWEDVTLEKWSKLINSKTKSKTKEALETISVLSDIPAKLIKELKISDVSVILSKIAELQSKANSTLRRIIKVDGVAIYIESSLSGISLGEYADLETYIQNGVEKNLPNIMAVLYRPIVEKKNKFYTITSYDGSGVRVRAEKFKQMKANDVNSALVFFWHFVKKLFQTMPSYLMEQTEKIVEETQTRTLQTSGLGSV